ncbi:MAG: hypothetical protein Q8N37_03420 [bacterium]|nr:hypothetical protein [bacterium]
MNRKYSKLHIEAIKLAWQLEGIDKKITSRNDFSEEIIEKLREQAKNMGIKYFDKPAVIGAELIYLSSPNYFKKDMLTVLLSPAGDHELETKLPQIIKNFKRVAETYNYDSRVKWNPNPENTTCKY